MKKKQVLALGMAATMILGSSMQIFAADGEDTTGVTVTGNGDVSYIKTDIYSVTLPTTNSTTLVVDPQGVSQMENDSVATAEDLASDAGKITCADTPIVTNLSSVPMKVSVELTLTGDATGVSTVADVEKDKNANVLLYAVPSAVDTKGDSTKYVASSKGVVLSSTAATLDFILDPATYNFKKDSSGNVTYELATGETGHGTGLNFGGYANKKADWTDYAGASPSKAIGMSAKFTFTKTIADGEAADTAEGAPYAMKAYSGNTVNVTPAEVGPSITPTTVAMTPGQSVSITVDLGRGDLAATGVSSVLNSANNGVLTVGRYYTYDDTTKTLTLTPALTGLASYASGGGVTVVFDDEAGTAVPVTLTVAGN